MVSATGCFGGVGGDSGELEGEVEREVEDDEAGVAVVDMRGESLLRMPRPRASAEINLRRLLENSCSSLRDCVDDCYSLRSVFMLIIFTRRKSSYCDWSRQRNWPVAQIRHNASFGNWPELL
jgi:hypothetical protein